MARSPDGGSYVYFIEAAETGLVKIGSARDPVARRSHLQVGQPIRLQLTAALPVDDSPAAESAIHERFAYLRERGEWFRLNRHLRRFIEEVRAEHGVPWAGEGRHPQWARTPAVEWLRRELADGPKPATVIRAAAEEAGITYATLRRAADALRVENLRVGFGRGGQWRWSLPAV